MTAITHSTIARVNLVLLVGTFTSCLAIAWHASSMSTKLEIMWADYIARHSAIASINPNHKGSTP